MPAIDQPGRTALSIARSQEQPYPALKALSSWRSCGPSGPQSIATTSKRIADSESPFVAA
jgi:hypothetical protein